MTNIKDKKALAKLKDRLDNKPDKKVNSKLPAGFPMYFYCKVCGHQSDKKPEIYHSKPKKFCTPCQELIDATELTSSSLKTAAKELED